MNYENFPFSKTTYYRRKKRAEILGCDIMDVPDGRGKHKNHANASRHYRWNNKKLLHSDGYVLIRVGLTHPWAGPNGYVLEHILIMCSAMGRFLKDDEVVHHKNKDRTDNRLENLELMTNSEHSTMHRKMERDKRSALDGQVYEGFPE